MDYKKRDVVEHVVYVVYLKNNRLQTTDSMADVSSGIDAERSGDGCWCWLYFPDFCVWCPGVEARRSVSAFGLAGADSRCRWTQSMAESQVIGDDGSTSLISACGVPA